MNMILSDRPAAARRPLEASPSTEWKHLNWARRGRFEKDGEGV